MTCLPDTAQCTSAQPQKAAEVVARARTSKSVPMDEIATAIARCAGCLALHPTFSVTSSVDVRSKSAKC